MLPMWLEWALFTVRIKLCILTTYLRVFLYKTGYKKVTMTALNANYNGGSIRTLKMRHR